MKYEDSSDSDEETIKTARSTYPLGYILKPYNRNVLKSTIEVALSIREVEARKNHELHQAYNTISNQTHELLESFKSAKEIQRAILPSESSFLNQFENAFILNLPKESLGGDFFWYKNLSNGRTLFAVVDCTGHGVPGALMSILVNYQLSKALNQLNEKDSLGRIFSIVDRVLSDTYEDQLAEADVNEIQNLNAGFDAALGMLDRENKKLTFCGAKRPLVLIRDGAIQEMKGNRSSVGLFTLADKGFETIEVKLRKGDHFYMYSDGFADQIGGPKETRLKSGPFKQKLLEFSSLEVSEQRKSLKSFFLEWMHIQEQMDDVLILGMKV